jgi:hypothetical protein
MCRFSYHTWPCGHSRQFKEENCAFTANLPVDERFILPCPRADVRIDWHYTHYMPCAKCLPSEHFAAWNDPNYDDEITSSPESSVPPSPVSGRQQMENEHEKIRQKAERNVAEMKEREWAFVQLYTQKMFLYEDTYRCIATNYYKKGWFVYTEMALERSAPIIQALHHYIPLKRRNFFQP